MVVGAPPPARAPTVNRQVVPAGDPLAHDQPTVLEAALKVVPLGTVSVTTTPGAPWLPTFDAVRTYTTVAPAVVEVWLSVLVRARSGTAVTGQTVGSAAPPGPGSSVR